MRSFKSSSVLGISFEDNLIKIAVLKRTNGFAKVATNLKADISFNPRISNPDAVGNELKNLLSSAGITESKCAVCVPLKWAFTLRVDIPDLPEEDVKSFLEVQVERNFPFPPKDLVLSTSYFKNSDGSSGGTIAAIPLKIITALKQLLKTAKLSPFSISFGNLPVMFDPQSDFQTILLFCQNSIDMIVLADGGIAMLKTFEMDEDTNHFDPEKFARQLRITLGQIPGELKNSFKKIKLYSDFSDLKFDDLQNALNKMDILVEREAFDFRKVEHNEDIFAFCKPVGIAAGYLFEKMPKFEFLPPQKSIFKRVSENVSIRSTLWIVGTAVTLIIIFISMFMFQSMKLGRLESEWQKNQPIVSEVSDLQDKIKKFRPWFDNSAESLVILGDITNAFPKNGAVWVKSLEIKDYSNIQFTGKAGNNRELLSMLDNLKNSERITDIKVIQVRGENPIEFRLTFTWNGKESNGI